MNNFKTNAFDTFYNSVVDYVLDHHSKNYPNSPKPRFEIKDGKRYIRIFKDGGAFCFVDKTNGNILKPASWSAPAKHARGNIYDDHNGMKYIGPYGPAYLRG